MRCVRPKQSRFLLLRMRWRQTNPRALVRSSNPCDTLVTPDYESSAKLTNGIHKPHRRLQTGTVDGYDAREIEYHPRLISHHWLYAPKGSGGFADEVTAHSSDTPAGCVLQQLYLEQR